MTTAIRTVDWETLRNQLNWVNDLAMRDLSAVFQRSLEMDPRMAQRYLEEAVADIVATFSGDAALLTEGWLDELMPERVPQVASGTPSIEQLTKQVSWGTAPLFTGTGNTLLRLSSVVQQHVFGAERDTVKAFAEANSMRWARVTRGDGDVCEFCKVLASRGAVYGSAARASGVGMSGRENHYVGTTGKFRGRRLKAGRIRGEQKHAEKYHDHCRCVVAPSGGGLSLSLPDRTSQYQEEYDAAVRLIEGPITMAKVTAAMRQLKK